MRVAIIDADLIGRKKHISYFKKQSLYEYVTITDYNSGGRASQKYIAEFKQELPDLADKYLYKKFWEV